MLIVVDGSAIKILVLRGEIMGTETFTWAFDEFKEREVRIIESPELPMLVAESDNAYKRGNRSKITVVKRFPILYRLVEYKQEN